MAVPRFNGVIWHENPILRAVGIPMLPRISTVQLLQGHIVSGCVTDHQVWVFWVEFIPLNTQRKITKYGELKMVQNENAV